MLGPWGWGPTRSTLTQGRGQAAGDLGAAQEWIRGRGQALGRGRGLWGIRRWEGGVKVSRQVRG